MLKKGGVGNHGAESARISRYQFARLTRRLKQSATHQMTSLHVLICLQKKYKVKYEKAPKE